jgi:hypothetical protein
MTITTEEAEWLAYRGMEEGGPSIVADALCALAAERDALKAENARLREVLGLTVTLFKQIMDAIEADPVETVLIARRDGAEVKRITVQECFDKTRALLGKKQ